MSTPTAKDKHGKVVSVGARVRILELRGTWLESLPKEEAGEVRTMIGQIFDVYQIDEWGQPWVEKQWHGPDGTLRFSHSLRLDPFETELLEDPGPS